MLTFGDVQNSTIVNIAGVCATSTQFAQYVSEAVDRLMKRGDWSGVLVPIRVCVSRGCVTWPRHVGQVRRMNTCHHHVAIRNVWYEFLEYGRYRRHGYSGWLGRERVMIGQFRAPTYNDIYGPNCTVRVYPQVAADIGATVTLFGIDNNGQPLQTPSPSGGNTMGITITVASPFGSTSTFVSRIDRVVKSTTQGMLTMYAYDSVNNVLWDLAVYEPSETSPDYLRYQLHGVGCVNNDAGQNPPPCPSTESVVALVKLKNIPVSAPTDRVLIDNIGALKLAVMGLRKEEAHDYDGANQDYAAAIAELNQQLEDENPDEQVPVANEPFSGMNFPQAMY